MAIEQKISFPGQKDQILIIEPGKNEDTLLRYIHDEETDRYLPANISCAPLNQMGMVEFRINGEPIEKSLREANPSLTYEIRSDNGSDEGTVSWRFIPTEEWSRQES